MGVATATLDSRLVLIAGIVGGVADALGNSIGFFVSQAAERAVQIKEANGDKTQVHSKKEVWMSGVFSFLATLFTLVFLLSPFMVLAVWTATTTSFIVGTIMAFLLGTYIGRLEGKSSIKNGIKYCLITVFGAVVSYGIGVLLHVII